MSFLLMTASGILCGDLVVIYHPVTYAFVVCLFVFMVSLQHVVIL